MTEPTFAALCERETRWLRTIRSVNPLGFAFLFITFPTPWLMAGGCLTAVFATGGSGMTHCCPAVVGAVSTSVGVAARLLLHARAARHQLALRSALPGVAPESFAREFWIDLPLLPLRDVLLLFQWIVAAFGTHVTWRGTRVPVESPQLTAHARSLRAMEVVEPSDGR